MQDNRSSKNDLFEMDEELLNDNSNKKISFSSALQKSAKDDFWDIESLLPKKKESVMQRSVSYDTKSTLLEFDHSKRDENKETVAGSSLSLGSSGEKSGEIVRFIPPHTAEEVQREKKPDLEYSSDNGFIRCVRVYDKSSKYENPDGFYNTAVKLWKIKGEECSRVPFFSYSPQYSQLNRSQLAWYLWWRDNFRRGVCLDTDYSYILLYVYEILNLSDKLKHEYCLDRLCQVWLNYGDRYEFLGRYLCEWICDFCLINRIAPPIDNLKKLYPFIFRNALLKEFYMFGNGEDGIDANMLMAICSTYDYTKSRFAQGQRLLEMQAQMRSVLEYLISQNSKLDGRIFGLGFSNSSVTRIAYSGAFCTNRIRKKIEVEFRSFARSHELRYLIADIMRYTENKLRSSWGVRSKLSIYALPTNIRVLIDEYFVNNPIKKNDGVDKYGNAIKNEYDKLYDAPNEPLSISKANEIEASSWDTTKILVEAFEEEVNISCIDSETKANNAQSQEGTSADIKDALGEKYEFLLAVLLSDRGKQREIAKQLSEIPEAIVDEINEIAVDILGDIIVEEDDEGGYRVIEEYREVLK